MSFAGSAEENLLKHDVFVITGGEPLHVPRKQADRLVAVGAAHWIAKRKIKLTSHGHGVAFLPEFDELRSDTSHWVGIASCGPKLTKEKQEFLHAMKQLSA
jgi:hypothetical protein